MPFRRRQPKKEDADPRPIRLSKKLLELPRKGSGNEAFPEWNPQDGLCPFEEKGEFQGFLRFFGKPMERVPLFRQFLKKGLKA